jgi:hypothetical protein
VRRDLALTSDYLQIRRRRRCRFVLITALAAWIGCADLLATGAAFNSNTSQTVRSQNHFRLNSGILQPQFCRFVPARSSARTIEVTEDEQEISDRSSSQLTVTTRPNSHNFTSDILSFRIVEPDHLIELPGTPPPAARS